LLINYAILTENELLLVFRWVEKPVNLGEFQLFERQKGKFPLIIQKNRLPKMHKKAPKKESPELSE
jgi:hypothetical protein